MKTLITILNLLLITCFSIACSSQNPSPKEDLSATQLREDLQIFRKALEEAHPALYMYTSKAEFDMAFKKVNERLDKSLSRQEFFKELMPLITGIRCGHVKFMPGNVEAYKYPFHSDKLLPLKVWVTKKGTYVWESYGTSVIPPGSRITAIDTLAMPVIVDSLLTYVTFADGTALDSKYLELSNYFSGYYAAFIQADTAYTVDYVTPEGVESSIEIPALTLSKIEEETARLDPGKKEEMLSLEISGETAILKISSFWLEDSQVNFEAFLRDSFREIKEKKIDNMIIDLRDNEGGKDSYGALLYSYLTNTPFNYYSRITTKTNKKFSFSQHAKHPWYFFFYRQLLKRSNDGKYLWKRHDNLKLQQPQKDAFLGEVFIIINGRSFSVTSEFAAIAYSNNRATFIGEETAGGYLGNNSGFFSIVHLPHSGFELGIPLWHYEMAVDKNLLKKGGIIPQYPVAPTIEDLLNGVDREMEVAKSLAARKILNE